MVSCLKFPFHLTPSKTPQTEPMQPSRALIILVVIAGLFGAVGVATAAAAAHHSADPRLATASNFLMLHAAALVGIAGAAGALGLNRRALLPGAGVALGTLLFCGDLIIRVAYGASPLPVAAPVGGSILIASWLALAAGAALGLRRNA